MDFAFEKLADIPLARYMIWLTISDDEFIAVPAEGDGTIYKFTVSTNQWTPIMKLNLMYFYFGIITASYDKSSNTLFVVTRMNVLSINMETAEIKVLGNYNLDILKGPKVVVVGEDRHFFGEDSEYFGDIHYREPKASDLMRTKPIELWRHVCDPSALKDQELLFVDKYLYSESRNSIIAYGVGFGYECPSVICEYALERNVWIKWPQMRWIDFHEEAEHRPTAMILYPLSGKHSNGTDTVITNDGRFIISVGFRRFENDKTIESGRMIVYDSEKMICGESKVVSPRSGIHKVVMMVNRSQDTLLAQAFVNQSIRSKLKGMVIPSHLIELIGKYFCNEFLHIFPAVDGGKIVYKEHFKINVDYVVEPFFISEDSECSQLTTLSTIQRLDALIELCKEEETNMVHHREQVQVQHMTLATMEKEEIVKMGLMGLLENISSLKPMTNEEVELWTTILIDCGATNINIIH